MSINSSHFYTSENIGFCLSSTSIALKSRSLVTLIFTVYIWMKCMTSYSRLLISKTLIILILTKTSTHMFSKTLSTVRLPEQLVKHSVLLDNKWGKSRALETDGGSLLPPARHFKFPLSFTSNCKPNAIISQIYLVSKVCLFCIFTLQV